MKKFLTILILCLILFVTPTNISFAMEYGFGELKLSNQVVNAFIKYIKGRNRNSPYLFAVAMDGLEYQYFICSAGVNSCRESPIEVIKSCEKYSKKYGSGAKCAVFAHVRIIKWDNGINKNTTLNSKWSEQEIRAKLEELGFLGEDTSDTSKTSTNLVDIEYPKYLSPFHDQKKETWKEYMSYKNSTEWPFSAWSEVRLESGSNYRHGWAADKTLKLAIKKATKTCEKGRKEYKEDFTNSELCIVYSVNGMETTDSEKKQYAKKFYKKKAAETFEKNSWILSSKSDFKDTTDNKNKGNTVEQLESLTRLYESGALTKEEFSAAKKKILND